MRLFRAFVAALLGVLVSVAAGQAQYFSAPSNPTGPAQAESPRYFDWVWDQWYWYTVSTYPTTAQLESTASAPGLGGALMMQGVVDKNDRSWAAYPNGRTSTINKGHRAPTS